ncbi:MAG: thioredoxin fold domain-containing protein [Thermodesulfobacteriota bacterium]
MKSKSVFFFTVWTVVFLITAWAAAALASGPQWTPYTKGLELAREQGKNVMINFYSDDCKFCRKMDAETFQDQAVSEFLDRHFVSIKVNTSKARDLSAAYYVRGLPTIWFLEAGGEKIAPLPGYVPAPIFLALLKFVRAKAYEGMTFQEYLDKGLHEK